jgi:2-oxoglutarate/2-oxoacid ferredoxin oxidoreductase subunit alpha
MKEVVWQIGGEQGTGLDPTSDVFNTVATRAGYYIYAYKTFASRIKGGHTDFTTRVSTTRVQAPAAGVNLLVALDQETIDLCARNLYKGSIVLADEAINPKLADGLALKLLTMPLQKMTQELANPLMKNVLALGASAALLGLPLEVFKEYMAEKFGAKGEAIVNLNHTALDRGFNYVVDHWADLRLGLEPSDGKRRLLMTGNDATALGALAAGCRIMFGYPITPASEVMENLIKFFPKVGGVALQMEDELASISATIGAGFAGARAMTSTAGPGISLMQEAIGLASMAEIPVVIVDTQRGGPSTGMPTKQEQSDLFALALGGHGDSPRILLAPGSVQELFSMTAEAFNLADNFHCPVLIASDLALALFQQTVEPEAMELESVTIDRGPVPDPAELAQLGRDVFQRYARTASSVSQRSMPGMKNGQFLATGAEHGAFGKVTENAANRVYMIDRRSTKLRNLPTPGVQYYGSRDADLVLVGFGSTVGALVEAQPLIEKATGKKVGVIQVRVLWPVPADEIREALGTARVLVVESNATGQFGFLMKAAGLDTTNAMHSFLKYDGTLFYVEEVVNAAEAVLHDGTRHLVSGGGAWVRAADREPLITKAAFQPAVAD